MMKISNIAADLINNFFMELKNQKIKYAVLRNYEGLPFENSSKDVDIVVNPKDYKSVKILLQNISTKLKYQLIWKNKLDYLEGFVFVKIIDNQVYSIKFDIFNGFLWRGCYYLDSEYILNNTIEYNGFKVPNKAHEAFVMIVYYLLYGKKIKTKYLIPIKVNITNNKKNFEDIVKVSFNSNISNKILKLVQDNRISDLITLRQLIKRDVIFKNIGFSGVIRLAQHIKTEYYIRWNFGILIVFSGPDGAGKSSLIQSTMDLITDLGISQSKIPHHFLTAGIPSLHRLPGAPKKYSNQDYTKPYQAKNAGFLSSIVRVFYYYFAFLIDYFINVKKELRGNNIVVFDRYHHDMAVDPSRMRICLSKEFVQNVFTSLPKADASFFILAENKLIQSRKEELEFEKISFLLTSYEELSFRTKHSKVLLNNDSIEEGQLMVIKNVFDSLEKHYQ